MPRVEEEAVACVPCGVSRVEHEVFTEEHINEICSAHGTAGMSGLGFFYHGGSQDSNVVCCLVKNFFVHNEDFFHDD